MHKLILRSVTTNISNERGFASNVGGAEIALSLFSQATPKSGYDGN
jgi:enolase